MKARIMVHTIAGEQRKVEIRLVDEESNVQFIEIEMSAAAFHDAFICNMGHVEVEYEVRGLDLIGAKSEHKTVKLRAEGTCSYLSDRAGEVRAAMEAMSVEDIGAGWKYRSGYGNHHNATKIGKAHAYNCVLGRHVRDGEAINHYSIEDFG